MSNLLTFEIALTGLDAQRLVLDVVAANIANVNTTRTSTGGPYKPQSVVLSQRSSFASMVDGVGHQLGGVQVAEVRELTGAINKVFDPKHADADSLGYVYFPDIDPAVEMVTLLKAKRAYEANIKVVNAAKTMALRALEIGS